MKKKLTGQLQNVGVILFWLALWQGIALLVNRELLVPTPTAVGKRLWELLPTLPFWEAVGGSLLRMLLGYLLGVAGGFSLAFATYHSRVANALLAPLFTLIRATPVSSFILIALVWIGAGQVPVLTSFLMVLPIIWNGVSTGLGNIDRKRLELCRLYGLPYGKRFRFLYYPTVRGPFFASCITAVGLSWKAGVAAEVLCVSGKSIGQYLYTSKLYLESVDLYAWTCTVIVLSLLSEYYLRRLSHRLTPKKEDAHA